MDNQSINFILGFSHSGLNSGKKNILSTIDQYLDSLEDISQSLVRHFGYILDGNRKLKNITSELFEYSISYRLIPPLQMLLDNQITMAKMSRWIDSVILMLISGPVAALDEKIDELAKQAGLDESFFYVPFPSGLILKKIEKFTELTQFLDEHPSVISVKVG